MKMNHYLVKLTLDRPALGTNPHDPDIHGTHIIEKERKLILEKSKVNNAVNKYLDAGDISEERKKEESDKIKERADELRETVGDSDEKGITCFFRNGEYACVGDHMIYGYMKAAAEAITRTRPLKKGVILHSASYTESIINQHVRCKERFISYDKDIMRNEDGSPDYLVRSLRVMTAKGPRVSIAKSEQVPERAKLEFTLRVLENSPLDEEAIRTIFDYGTIVGLGQWRNAGYGTFNAEVENLGVV
jgi:hypothetical protein